LTDSAIDTLLRNEAPLSLVPKVLDYFPRHRWFGAQSVIRECVVFSNTHDIMREASAIWFGKRQAEPQPAHLALAFRPAYPALQNQAHGTDPDAGAFISDEEGETNAVQGVLMALVAPELTADHTACADPQDFNTFKKRMKADAHKWAASDPKHRLVIMGLTFASFERYLKDLVYLNSEDWKLKNDIASAAGGRRRYRLLEAHNNTLENKCATGILKVLTDPDAWHALPFDAWTLKNRSLAFRILSRRACGLHLMSVLPHTMDPFAIFKLLEDDAAKDAEVQRTRPCQQNEFTAMHAKVYPGDRLLCPESRAVLAAKAEGAMEATSRIECGNAFWQREVRVKSVQVVQEHFNTASATYLHMRQRRYEAKFVAHPKLPREELPRQRRRKKRRSKKKQPAKKPRVAKADSIPKSKKRKRKSKPKAPGDACPRISPYTIFAGDFLRRKGEYGHTLGMSEAYKNLSPAEHRNLSQRCEAKRRKFKQDTRIAEVDCRPMSVDRGEAVPVQPQGAPSTYLDPELNADGRPTSSLHEDQALVSFGSDCNQLALVQAQEQALAIQSLSVQAQQQLVESRASNDMIPKKLTKIRSDVRVLSKASRVLASRQEDQLAAWQHVIEQASLDNIHPATGACRRIVPSHASTLRCEFATPAIAMSRHIAASVGAPRWGGNVAPDKDSPVELGIVEGLRSKTKRVAPTLHTLLRDGFQQRSRTYIYKEQSPLGNIKPSAIDASMCRHLAMCLCGDALVPLKLFRLYFVAVARGLLKKLQGNSDKQKVEDAEAVICLVFDSIDCEACDPSDMYWFHIGWVNQNSWAISMMRLELDTDAINQRQAKSVGNVALRAAPEHILQSDLGVFEKLGIDNCPRSFIPCPLERVCRYKMYRVNDAPRALTAFIPACVEVEACAAEASEFWPGSVEALKLRKSVRNASRKLPLAPGLSRPAAAAPAPVLDGVIDEPDDDDIIGPTGDAHCGGGDADEDIWFDALVSAMDEAPPENECASDAGEDDGPTAGDDTGEHVEATTCTYLSVHVLVHVLICCHRDHLD
jgi:hypothetical protein